KRLKQANIFLVEALSTTIEFRNCESGEHVRRMSNLTGLLLQMINDTYKLPPEEIEAIANASMLHDIGKIAIPDSVLTKPGRLTPEEFDVMKTHTTKGSEILNSLSYMPDQKYFEYCYEICRYHHERWDGKGYPDGLKGDEIPIWAQAAALADVYDALTSDRVYKKSILPRRSHAYDIGRGVRRV
ncbi:HD domain-containing protein, partial [Christensenellaceae bacterium OttesenSCG-928-K19]|nr:HD domain-containing protein [Christensenellaceae bacterium OttesenSCG-928-K19]